MATNFTAALLAVILVVLQMYCMGLYSSDGDATTAISAEPSSFEADPNQTSTTSLAAEDDFVLSYDLSSSPALLYLDNAMR